MNRPLRLLVRGLALLALVFYCTLAVYLSRGSLLQDFVKFYAAAGNFRRGDSLYAPVAFDRYTQLDDPALAELGDDALHPNLNLPAVSLLFLPFTLLKLSTAYLLWFAASLALLLASALILHRRLQGDYAASQPLSLMFLLLLLYFPTLIGLWLGQVSSLLLFLLAVVFAAYSGGRERTAGIALGFALVLKVNTGLLLLVFLVQRRWKLALWAAATFLLANLAGLLVFGWDEHLAYLGVLRGVTWQAASWNASFQGFFTRIFGGSENVPILDAPWLATGLSLGFSILLVGLVVWSAWPRRQPARRQADLAFALALPAALLISPLGWMYYFPALIISALVGWQVAGELGKPAFRWLIALAWLLSTVPHWIVRAADVTRVETFGWAGVYFYALLLLCGVLAGLAVIGLRAARRQA